MMLRRTALHVSVAVLACAPAMAQDDLYSVPGGFTPPTNLVAGDVYHLAFVSSATTNALSKNINWYNNWVQQQANNAGIGANVGVAWYAICSLVSNATIVHAKNNAFISGPVYLLDAKTQVIGGYAGTWDGGQYLDNAINMTERGNILGKRYVWTGTDRWGNVAGNGLGGPGATKYGDARPTGGGWIDKPGGDDPYDDFARLKSFYGLSEPLTVAAPSRGIVFIFR